MTCSISQPPLSPMNGSDGEIHAPVCPSDHFTPMDAHIGFAVPLTKQEMSTACWREREGEFQRRCGSVDGDVAAKVTKEYGCGRTKHKRRMHTAGLLTFFIPDEVPEHTQLETPLAQSVLVDIRKWQEKNGDFVLEPHPTGMVTAKSSCGTLVEPCPASKAGSMISVASSDMYGWEESLSRRTSNELHVTIAENLTTHECAESHGKTELPLSPKNIPKHTSRTRNLLHKVLHPSSSSTPRPVAS